MKRTKAKITGASFFQFHKTTNDLNDIDAAENLLYGILCNQSVGKLRKTILLRVLVCANGSKQKLLETPYICNLMTLEKLNDIRERILVLRRFL